LKQTIGSKVKYYRNLKGLTQFQLAEALSVSIETIYNTESGRKVSLDLLEKIAEHLGIPIKLLFDFEPDTGHESYITEIELLCKGKSKEEISYIIDFIKLTNQYKKF